ncbi:STM4015 family protein [Nocardia fusca]|uniref:STM4015 family protein n=1 Tax=Nocardia fusca TaxID=941183 RepID=UPI00379CECEB
MINDDHLSEFGGLPVFDFPENLAAPEHADATSFDHPAVESVAWRVGRIGWDSEASWTDLFDRFVELVDTTRVRAFVVASWVDIEEDSAGPVDAVLDCLVAAREWFPELRALFIGDITQEENEISWICQGRVTALLDAFPELTEFVVRGSQQLVFPALRHERLEKLTIQTGGLPATVVRGVAASDFPALTHLELWLGTPNYHGDAEVADLAAILAGDRLPALRHLGLRNSEIQDDICTALAAAPVVARLESLDLSLGILTDAGAAALLGGQPLTHLESLDLHHNYLSAEIRDRLRDALSPKVELDLDPGGAETYSHNGEVWRYVSIGE